MKITFDKLGFDFLNLLSSIFAFLCHCCYSENLNIFFYIIIEISILVPLIPLYQNSEAQVLI